MLKINCKTESITKDFDVTIIKVDENISGSNNGEFRTYLKEHTDNGCCDKLILDLSGLRFINSSGLGAIANLSMQMRKSNGQFAIICPNKEVLQVFEITKLNQVLNIVNDRKTAIQFLKT